MGSAEYQARLHDKLTKVNEEIESHRAAVHFLEIERTRLEYMLRNSGYWLPAHHG